VVGGGDPPHHLTAVPKRRFGPAAGADDRGCDNHAVTGRERQTSALTMVFVGIGAAAVPAVAGLLLLGRYCARELGGGIRAQSGAALAWATAPVALGSASIWIAAGVGMEATYTIATLLVALVVGLALTDQRGCCERAASRGHGRLRPERAAAAVHQLRPLATIDNRWHLDNEERGRIIALCHLPYPPQAPWHDRITRDQL
jgi:hypothetical protein